MSENTIIKVRTPRISNELSILRKQIANKLNVDIRSVGLILTNHELCKRIIEETPIRVTDYAIKYDISASTLKGFIDRGIISSFRNKYAKGSGYYIFEEESNRVVNIEYRHPGNYLAFKTIGKVFLLVAKSILTEYEYESIGKYFQTGSTTSIDSFSPSVLTVLRASAFRKLFRFNQRVELLADINALRSEISHLKLVKTGILKSIDRRKANEEMYNLNRYKQIVELDLSVRAYNSLVNIGVTTVDDILQYTKSDILRRRNVGMRTVNEVESVLSELGLQLKQEL